MTLLPFEKVRLVSPAPPEEVMRRLAASVEPKKWLRFSRDHLPFQGQLRADGFTIARIIHYRNSFLPTVVGRVHAQPGGGAVIEATLRPNWAVLVFSALWMAGLLVAGFTVVAKRVSADGHLTPALILGGMLLAGYGLILGGFAFEARRAKRFLESCASGARAG